MSWRRLDLLTLFAWAVLTLTVIDGVVRTNEDMSLLLTIGGRLVDGGQFYVDYLETNPPWIHLLMMVPMGIAALTGAPPHTTYHLLVALLLGASILATRAVLRDAEASEDTVGLVGIAVLTHGAIAANAQLWGQKEHLVFLSSLPWFVALATSDGRPRARGSASTLGMVAVGVVAAIGVQIKIHYVLLGLLFAGGLVATRRRPSLLWSPAFLGYALGGIGYPMLLLGMSEASQTALREIYFPIVAPGYATYDNPMWAILLFSTPPFLAYVAAALAAVRFGELPRLARPMVAYVALGVVVFLVQRKGFPYHRIPLLGGAAILAALGVAGAARKRGEALTHAAAMFGLALVLGVGTYRHVVGPEPDPVFDLVEEHIPQGSTLLFIDTTVPGIFPGAVERDYPLANHFLPAFPIIYAYAREPLQADGTRAYHTLDEAPVAERMLFESLADDLATHDVAAVVVRTSFVCWTCEGSFDALELLAHNGFLGGPMADFVEVGVADEHTVFVHRRYAP